MYKQNKINMENLKTIQIKDKDYVKVNPDTGEVKDAYITRKVSMDEFIMLFFNSFPELFKLEGNALKILMCIWKKSSYNPFEDSGNLFYNKVTLKEGYPLGIVVLFSSIIIAILSLKFYDEPVRNWLTNKYQKLKVAVANN